MAKNREKAICLLSGGMDSVVALAIAIQDYDVAVMHAYYGQLTQEREIQAFREITEYYDIRNVMIFSLAHLTQIGGSSLTDPEISMHTGGSRNNAIPNTYVPFRNAHLLTAAVSWAEVLGARKIFIGAVEEDSSGYPDCTESFFKAFDSVIKEGTLPDTRVEIAVPLLHMSKTEIVRMGTELEVPFDLTWSCYRQIEKACGICDSCILRLNAFREAGISDPIPYGEQDI